MPSEFKIGTANTIYDFLPIDTLLNTSQGIDPDWSFRPYSTSVRLANGQLQGNGFPIAIWRWNALSLANRQVLRDLITTGLSASMYIRTATNDVDVYGDIVYKSFSCIMTWTDQDEDIQADSDLGVILTFTHLVEVI
jgi:hypothetical protein